ncbi:MAG: ammonium transporter [Cyanobacteria bacterium P01_C01_bin.89]
MPIKDIAWLLGCSALVFLMQAGFLCLESGLTRSKNSINVAVKNLSDFGLAVLVFWMSGYALMFGDTVGGWFGASDWFVSVEGAPYIAAFFVFQAMFCGTATTIVSGAAAERLHYGGYLLISLLNAAIIYPLFGHWAWNGIQNGGSLGWLARIGFVDFAGSTVVHLVGASVAFAVLLIVGARHGRFGKGGRSRKIGGSDLPLSMLGTMLLWLGWLGFNGGSSLMLDASVARIIVHTLIAGTSGMLTASVFSWWRRGIPDVEPLINGGLAGLVGVTAGCNAMTTPQSAFVGAIAAMLMLWMERQLERWHIDDAVGAIPVHGISGIWGTLAVAIFGDPQVLGTGLNRLEQLAVLGFGVGVAIAWGFGLSYVLLLILNRRSPLRVSLQAESIGLNVAEHNARTELHDLFEVMDQHVRGGDLRTRVPVEPNTEAGYIATRYNKVMDALQKKTEELEGFNANLEALVRDRTLDLQSANRELHRLDELKDQFLANTSHELRTPLNGIIGLAESLSDGSIGVINPNQYKSLSLIVQSGYRLIHLVDDILDFSKFKNNKLLLDCRSLDISPIVKNVIELYQAQAQMQHLLLTSDVEANLPRLWGDGDRIYQILNNLIGNALKFTEAGTITVKAQSVDGEDGSEILLSVTDTGVGIAKENLDHIFRAFEQGDGTTARRYGGAGLGLAITHQLVELHHGEIWVKSTVGEGSTFFVKLPRAELVHQKLSEQRLNQGEIQQSNQQLETDHSNEAEPRKILVNSDVPLTALTSEAAVLNQVEETSQFSLENIDDELISQTNLFSEEVSVEGADSIFRVLIVDDEPINQKVLADYLGNGFYEVRTVGSGQAALRTILEEQWLPNVVLMDIMMPFMSGYEATQQLRKTYSPGDLPVIMLTAKNQVNDIVQGLEVGANDYLTKPISKRELLARLKTHLELTHLTVAYGRFVPHEFLDLLQKDSILEVDLGDQIEQEMAILFADIRAFTTLSETMTPSENFQFINAYLSRMEPVIHKHGGFIDKFIGDAIMALFPQGSEGAIAAATEMLHTLKRYNETRSTKGWQPIEIGIGINAGSLRLGTVGGRDRMNGTAIGDAVNLASRLESLTKEYDTPLLISQQALVSMADPASIKLRFVDRQQVKGKSVPVAIFEVLDGLEPEVRDRRLNKKAEFESALWLYYSEQYPKAIKILAQYLQSCPKDRVAQIYLKRAMQKSRLPSADN